MVGAADWINHAIVLDEELCGGLNRLIAGEFVDEVEGGFGLTVAGEALLAKVSNRAGLWKRWDRLEAELMNLAHPPEPLWVPREGEIDQAIQAYHRRARELIDSLARSHQRRGS